MSLFTMCSISLLVGVVVGGLIVHVMWRRSLSRRFSYLKTEFDKEINNLNAKLKTAEKEAKTWHYRATAALRIHD